MGEWRARPWRKIWRRFHASPKVRGTGSDGLALISVLIADCWWDDASPEGRMYIAEGVPMPLEDVFELAQLTRSKGIAAWSKLEAKKTVGIVDGCPALLNYLDHQKGESTDRMRRHRDRTSPSRDAQVRRTSPSPVTEEEVEVEAEQHASHAGQPAVAKRAARSKPKAADDPHRDATARVLRALNETRASIAPDLTPLRKRDHIRARLADGATVEQLLAVIAFAADECRRKPEALRWLDAVTPFRPKNWESRLARAQAWQATSRTSPRLDVDHDALERRRREAEAFDREHRPWLFESASEEPA